MSLSAASFDLQNCGALNAPAVLPPGESADKLLARGLSGLMSAGAQAGSSIGYRVYCRVAVQAALLPKGSMDRLLLVAAFAQSGFAAGLRPYKCLNPVMGETFEVCNAHT